MSLLIPGEEWQMVGGPSSPKARRPTAKARFSSPTFSRIYKIGLDGISLFKDNMD
jgi:hypothetical protein